MFLDNVKEANSGCGAPVSEMYRQMSRQSPKVDIFLDLTFEMFQILCKNDVHSSFSTYQMLTISGSCLAGHERK